jgi:hypothetical protein
MTMKTLVALVLALAAFAPAASAQTGTPFNGKWDVTYILARPDGTDAPPSKLVLNITQKGKEITGTAGPADQQQPIVNGVATGTKATFDVQMPQGPPFKFSLSIVKGRLQGQMTREAPDGTVRQAKVDGEPAAAEKK